MTDVQQVKQGETSAFIFNDANLASLPVYLGTFGANMVESMSKSKGSLEPIIARDPSIPNKYNIVGTLRGSPELGETSITERMHPAAFDFLETIYKTDCERVLVIGVGACGDLTDITNFDKYLLAEGLRLNNIDIGALQALDANGLVELNGTANITDWNTILKMRWSEFAGDEVLAQVIDAIYSDAVSCGDCAPFSEGCGKFYSLTVSNTGSPGLSSQLVYSTDDKVTWVAVDIASLGGQNGSALQAVGTRLVVFSEIDEAHHYISKNAITSSGWTRVSTGYESGGGPRAAYARSTNEIFITGAGGYIYLSSDITDKVVVKHDATSTTQDGNAIHANGQTVVSVHDGNTIMVSINGGESYSIVTTDAGLNGPEAGANLLTVYAVSATQWYIGTNSGILWFTSDSGANWTQRSLEDQANITAVLDINFSPDSQLVGAIAVQKTLTGHVYRTITGGRTWSSTDPAALPTNEKINAVVLCGFNEIAAVGLKSGSTDGVIAFAEA